MSKKVVGADDMCFICGRQSGSLDRHHVFFGANRKLSEEDGLCVMLCHMGCHQFGPESVHMNHNKDLWLKQTVQQWAMIKYGWTTEQFIARYGRNYIIDESGQDIWPKEEEVC